MPAERRIISFEHGTHEADIFYIKVIGVSSDVRIIDPDYSSHYDPDKPSVLMSQMGSYDTCKPGVTPEQCKLQSCYGTTSSTPSYINYGYDAPCDLGAGVADTNPNICRCTVNYSGKLSYNKSCIFRVRAGGGTNGHHIKIAAVDSSNNILRSRVLDIVNVDGGNDAKIQPLYSHLNHVFMNVEPGLFTEERVNNNKVFESDFLGFMHLYCKKDGDNALRITNFPGRNLLGIDSKHDLASLPDMVIQTQDSCAFRDNSGNCIAKFGLASSDYFVSDYTLLGSDITYS